MKYVKKGALTTIAAAWLVLLAITTGCTVEGIPYENELAASTQMTMTVAATNNVTFALGGTGSVKIDWGDGSNPETVTVVPFDENLVVLEEDLEPYLYSHKYSSTANRTITVNGNNVTHLACFGSTGTVTHLDVSKNTALTFLLLDELNLPALDVSKNTALIYLECWGNKLTSLDVSKNIALLELFCDDNELTSIDVSKNTALTFLSLTGNPLTNLDVSKNAKLKDLYVDNCLFSASGFNTLFGTLHSQTVTGGKTIYIKGNPGTASCNTKTATDGGWTVDKGSETPIAVTGVTLNKSALSLTVSQNETLIATVAPSNATNKAVTWSSTNNLIATVDATGKVTAVKEGTATIIATTADGGKKANCTVTVNAAGVPVTDVMLNQSAWTISEDANSILTATVLPLTATNKTVTWSSDNPGIATVDASGKVIGIIPGIANITATTADGGYTATCKLTVISAAKEMNITANGAGEKIIALVGTGTAVIYWGDGTMANVPNLQDNTFIPASHTYMDGVHYISVVGENITGLDCKGQGVSHLNVSKNTTLTELYCGNNRLESLNLSNNATLYFLSCGDNALKSLNLINNTTLLGLLCSNNQLTAEALDNLFHSLHNNTYSQKKIMITGNPGAASCNMQIATDKGWTFVTEL